MVGVSVVLAALSARAIERPVRSGRLGGRRLALTASTLCLALVAAAVLPGRVGVADDMLSRLAAAAPPAIGPTTPVRPTRQRPVEEDVPDARVAPVAPVVGWYGDSVAFTLLFATATHAPDDAVRFANLNVTIGCGVALVPPDTASDCTDRLDLGVRRVATTGATVALVASCQWELLDATLPGLATTRSPGDPVFDDYVARRYDETIDRLRGAGIERVLWVACPHQSQTVGTAGMPEQYLAAREPWRVDRINDIVAEIAAMEM